MYYKIQIYSGNPILFQEFVLNKPSTCLLMNLSNCSKNNNCRLFQKLLSSWLDNKEKGGRRKGQKVTTQSKS